MAKRSAAESIQDSLKFIRAVQEDVSENGYGQIHLYDARAILAVFDDFEQAMAQARLEGAKAMQEAAAERCVPMLQNHAALSIQRTAELCGEAIRALDPQQIINESMEK